MDPVGDNLNEVNDSTDGDNNIADDSADHQSNEESAGGDVAAGNASRSSRFDAFLQALWRRVEATASIEELDEVGRFVDEMLRDLNEALMRQENRPSLEEVKKVIVEQKEEGEGSEGSKRIAESDECPICYEDFKENREAAILPCSHFFHFDCVSTWLQRKATCPLCRCEMDKGDGR